MTNATDLISQREKREIMENDRLVREAGERRGRTYAGHALDNEPEVGGRFKRVTETTVIGKSPITYPRLPSGPWSRDACPPEPPLGYSVEEQEPVGEMFERASTSAAPEVGEPPSPSAQSGGGGRPITKSFVRRF